MMLRLWIVACVLMAPLFSHAAEEAGDSDDAAIYSCLKNWGKHPFAKKPDFRVIASKVRVMGIGDSVDDEKPTAKPELILVKPNVTVMAKTEMKLNNPQGWYCLKANVSVMGKTVIKLNCKANLASSKDGATVMGASDVEGSVAVMGSARIEKVGCPSEVTE